MKIITTIFASTICLVIAASSCKKDKVLTNSELLTSKPWKLTAYTVKTLSTGIVTDAFSIMTACYKDDEYVYKTNMNFEGNAGPVKCSAADPHVFQSGTWSFKNNETVLERIITSGLGIGTIEYKVMSLTASELKLHFDEGDYHLEFTYAH